MDFYITKPNFEKLILLCNDEKTYTMIINEAIEGKYFNKYKTNDVITKEQKEKIDIASYNWLKGDSQ